MSVTFLVEASSNELPPFNALLSGIPQPVQLSGAGWTGEPWPRGLYARIVDAAAAPTRVQAMSYAASSGSFIAYVPGAARGVVVSRAAGGKVAFTVPVLASSADYVLATRLAAAAAKASSAQIIVDGQSVEPDALLAQWTPAHADTHARERGTWLAEDIAQGRTYYVQGPVGFVELGANLRDQEGDRFDNARAILRTALGDDERTLDERREAILLTAAMVFAAGADGVLADEEARQLEAHFGTVKELSRFPAKELLDSVRTEVTGIDALGELGERLRRKAFVLASEVIASARDGKLGGDANDPNVQAVSALAKSLSLDTDQIFLAQVIRTVMAKYEDVGADEELLSSLSLAMLLTATADGIVDDAEASVLSALARTVPELRTIDLAQLFTKARSKAAGGADAALKSLGEMPKGKEKCVALATEVALIAGKNPDETLLPRLVPVLGDADLAASTIATFAAKYS